MDEIHAALEEHYFDFRLDVLGRGLDLAGDLDVVHLGGVTVGRVSFGTEISMRWRETGAYQVTLPLTGAYSAWQGRGPTARVTPAWGFVSDPAADTALADWTYDADVVGVKVDKLALHRQLETLLGRTLHRPPQLAQSFEITRGPGRSWVNLVRWGLLEKDIPNGLLEWPIIAGRLEQTLLEGLLLATDHRYRTDLDAPPPKMPGAAVKRVMDVVREYPAEPYDAARLAGIADVSLRTLQEAFRKELRMTPMGYVQEVRLQRVRQHLRVSAPGTVTVTDVAYRWGFAHLGRFAQRYRARFGESPSQTLRSA